jgi:ubiquinone/menaquinone biosynthesis C-methylase UbiE
MDEIRPDVLAARNYIYSLLDLESPGAVLDVGCGKGGDLRRIAERVGGECRFVGVDSSEKAIEQARAESPDSRLEFLTADVSQSLPFESESFGLVYSNNFVECLTDKDALVREVHRVLRPRGQVAFAHCDWDSQLFDGSDKDLVRKIVHAYGDWKQAWMADCDSWMGRRLWRVFNRSGLFSGAVHTYVLTNTEFAEPSFGHARVKDFEGLVKRGMISKEEYDRFYQDLVALAEKGEYLYSITVFVYVGRKGAGYGD